jgi:hypothetical protein
MNCVDVCPKGLNPTKAIGKIKELMVAAPFDQPSTGGLHDTHARPNAIDERELSKLRWRCRRGLLENDLFIERFFARHEDHLTDVRQADALAR